jgi:TorA maturation chaperone TorD
MNNSAVIYATLSRLFSDILDIQTVTDIKNNISLLELLGENSQNYFNSKNINELIEELNIDFSSMFLLNTQPIESFILDAKQETLVGLQNPVMEFYFRHGFEIDMNQTDILSPDHISIEFGFLQTLAFRGESKTAKEFLDKHLIRWVVPYLLGMRIMATTPFFQDLFSFTIEFILLERERLDNL